MILQIYDKSCIPVSTVFAGLSEILYIINATNLIVVSLFRFYFASKRTRFDFCICSEQILIKLAYNTKRLTQLPRILEGVTKVANEICYMLVFKFGGCMGDNMGESFGI